MTGNYGLPPRPEPCVSPAGHGLDARGSGAGQVDSMACLGHGCFQLPSRSFFNRFTARHLVHLELILAWILVGLHPAVAAPPGQPLTLSTHATDPTVRSVGFDPVASATSGIQFTNRLSGDAYLTNAVAHNGSGVAIGDVNGDGLPDIYLCQLEGPNQLFQNKGAWKFENVPLGPAACETQRSTGAAFADVDGDGDLDLLVNGIRTGTRLFLNDGQAHWTVAADSGLARETSSTSMALADMDGDGDLDLYVAHYIDVMHLVDPTTQYGITQENGKFVVNRVNGVPTTDPRLKDRFEVMPDGEVRELPEMDALYQNDGRGRFVPVHLEPGRFLDESGRPIVPPRDWGMAVVFRDLNGDGAPDLIVSNDYASPDRFWLNDGRGHFRAMSPLKIRHTSFNSMGIDVADVNRDGVDDIFIVDLLAVSHERRLRQVSKTPPDPRAINNPIGRPQFNRNMLFLGHSDGGYSETALMAGIAASNWSWTPVFLDVDLDGFEDLLISNGFEFDLMDQDTHDRQRDPNRRLTREQSKRWMQFAPTWRTQGIAYRNRGDGTFEDKSVEWGFQPDGLSFGMALGDLDNDGDLDVVVNRMNGPVAVYQNLANSGRIAVRLKGISPNTAGVGARIRLIGDHVTQTQELVSGGRYLSSDQSLRTFALDPRSTNSSELEIRWRSGRTTRLTHIMANRLYEVVEDPAIPTATVLSSNKPAPFFIDASSLMAHALESRALDDSAYQPLIPRRLSQLGTGLAWWDVDGDGWEDLMIGAPRGGPAMTFMNQAGRGFSPVPGEVSQEGERGVLGWVDGQGKRKRVSTLPPQATDQTTSGKLKIGVPLSNLPPTLTELQRISPGHVATGDLDGDGDLDLFVAGQSLPGRYPVASPSSLWLNESGGLRRMNPGIAALNSTEIVSASTMFDCDGDGDLDLALATEWGPVRILRNDQGKWIEQTKELGISERRGWWTGIVAGDFDGDGQLDLAVGNAGRNTGYALFRPSPIRIYFDESTADGPLTTLESFRLENRWRPIKNRSVLSGVFPDVSSLYPTHLAFASASISEILGSRTNHTRFLEATEFDSGVFLNRNRRFEWHPFPAVAQAAPAFSVNAADFDGDGIEDVFLSQNRSDLLTEFSRDDAGRGLWLKGQGNGTFKAIEPSLSGMSIWGEQRSAALADFNRDGRIDIAVTQVDGPLRLFLNRGARPGLLVELRGTAKNPDGIGAVLRVVYADGTKGPARAIHAGSGFCAQDSPKHVLGMARTPSFVEVTWPGGNSQKVSIPPESHRLQIKHPSGE